MTRDELQHLHDRYKQTGRYSHLLALADGVHRFLDQPDPTVEIAYLKAKLADLSDEYPTRWTQGRRPPMSHDDIKAALEAASTPWESIPALLDDERRVVRKDGGGDLAQGCSCDYATLSAADAHLIAHAPEWLAELLAENERLRDSIQHCADTLALHECERPEIERLTDENDRLRLADDYKPEGVDIVMAKLRDYRRRAEAAEQWKTEALPVIDGLQELGAALGIPLGKRITGPDALAAVKALTERAEAAEATVRRVRRLAESWATQPTDYDEDTEQQIEDGRAILRALDGGAS